MHEAAAKQDVRDGDQNGADKPSKRDGWNEMPDAGGKEVDQCHWQHELPREVHQLVHAKAWKRAADPDQHGDQHKEFGEEPEVGRNPGEKGKWCGPASEKERDSQSADREHPDVFAEEKQSELKPEYSMK